MKVLVITGGIGSGKSEVCRIMHELGITAQYNADTRVKELYHRHPTLLSSIENKLGARGLRSICERIMTDAMYDAPSTKKKVFNLTVEYARERLS